MPLSVHAFDIRGANIYICQSRQALQQATFHKMSTLMTNFQNGAESRKCHTKNCGSSADNLNHNACKFNAFMKYPYFYLLPNLDGNGVDTVEEQLTDTEDLAGTAGTGNLAEYMARRLIRTDTHQTGHNGTWLVLPMRTKVKSAVL